MQNTLGRDECDVEIASHFLFLTGFGLDFDLTRTRAR
jgi:hypothetical protein